MLRNSRGAATHSQRLEKWLGPGKAEQISAQFESFYWPVPVAGVPGRVYVMPGGDFAGPIEAGYEASALDRADDLVHRHHRTATRYRLAQMFPSQRGAFGDLSALVAAARGGKRCTSFYTTTTNPSGNHIIDLWTISGGSSGGAAPGGTATTSATAGCASGFATLGAANTSVLTDVSLRFVNATSASACGFILYDRLFSVAKTMNSTATEAVTGAPTRYQSSTSTAGDYIGGNFCYAVSLTGLAATAHNWTVCKYTNQAGTTGQSMPSAAGRTSNIAANMDLGSGGNSDQWFMPLASGDVGVKALTQMQCDALVATGTVDFVVGHVLAAVPCPLTNLLVGIDCLNTAFSLVKVYDNACMSFLINSGAQAPNPFVATINTVSE